jgi:hypothetical protein
MIRICSGQTFKNKRAFSRVMVKKRSKMDRLGETLLSDQLNLALYV